MEDKMCGSLGVADCLYWHEMDDEERAEVAA